MKIKQEENKKLRHKPVEDEWPAEVVLFSAFGFPALSVQPHCCTTGRAAGRNGPGRPIHLSSGRDTKLQRSSYPISPSLRNTGQSCIRTTSSLSTRMIRIKLYEQHSEPNSQLDCKICNKILYIRIY